MSIRAAGNPASTTTRGAPVASLLLPEWRELDVDDASWIASIEASRREVFAELADL